MVGPKITTTVSVDVDAPIETEIYSFFGTIFADEQPTEPVPPPSPPKISEKKLSARLSLTMIGIARNGIIEVSRSSTWP
jgi:hypothetical protein